MLRSRAALGVAFLAVHLWIGLVGTVLIPTKAFWDLDLYRWWMWQGLHQGIWPVLDGDWVYPAGAVVPMLLPGLVDTWDTRTYAVAWTVLITALNALAAWTLLRVAGHRAVTGVWWWLGFIVLLGPVAVGRLDAVVAPLVVTALALALRHPAVASALLTFGAWVKVAPGALLLPLVMIVRRPWRTLVLPAASVCVVIAGIVAAGGGLSHLFSFLGEQGERGLQLESVAATAWVLRGLVDDGVRIWMNDDIITWEIAGPGTATMSGLLGYALPVALAAATGLLFWVRRRAGDQLDHAAFLARSALLIALVLIVANKVGSPQFIGWLAGPVVVGLARPGRESLRSWRVIAVLVLVIAALTQGVFPLAYDAITAGAFGASLLLVARNLLLVVTLVLVTRSLWRMGRSDRVDALSPAAA
ncbi:glycosyltransferase 87 family protein [Cellulomonas sp. NPDC089187]|uniref:glycosyltransferase 87 family protein n=1 Tax=Cellulomonas sp. NPDC089187 TaxID=3154970 RepID=UPI00341D79B0